MCRQRFELKVKPEELYSMALLAFCGAVIWGGAVWVTITVIIRRYGG